MKNTKFQKSHNEAYHLFFEAMLEGGVESILKTANQIFKSPVLFTNENYRLICQVPAKPIGESIWDALYKRKTLSPEIIWDYQELFLDNQVGHYEPLYANWGLVEEYPRIFGEVVVDNKIFGHVAIFLGTRPLKDGDLEIARIFIDALKIEISRKKNEYYSWLPSSSIYLMDLLVEDASSEVKNLAVQKLRKNLTGDFALIVTPIGTKASQKAFSSYAVAELPSMYRNIVATIYEDSIVILIGEVDATDFSPAKSVFIGKIINFLSEHKMASGISESFSNLQEMPVRFRQALLTARIAIDRGDTFLGVYKDYAPLQLFFSVASTDKTQVFVHPVLAKLRSYDDKHSTDYFNTLKIYSLSMHNKDSAALQLMIHRNTLLYRLNRIKDIFGVAYEDEGTALHLLTSFLLIDALK